MLTVNDIRRRISPHVLRAPPDIFDPKNNSSDDLLARKAAVLIIVHSRNAIPHIFLTRRSSKLKYHTGEISFPGGQYSKGDDLSILDTALRETREEIGLCFKSNDILGSLQTVHTLTSNFTIVPFITIQESIPAPKIFASEVDCVLDVPLQETLATVEPDIEHYHISQEGVYKFTFQRFVIWGATARILKQLYDHLYA
jgi:8-oxo-dGTP pyrophosphatase MutT (NUDIX family)